MGAECPFIETDLTDEEAFVVLEPYFIAVREQMIDRGFTRLNQTRFKIGEGLHDTARHYAGCRDDGKAIFVAPELAELPPPTTLAILTHECGHALDFLYPGEFVMGKASRIKRVTPESFENEKQWVRWRRAWERRDDDTVEFTADAIAEYVTGVRYGYLGPCMIQSFEATRRRPKGLR